MKKFFVPLILFASLWLVGCSTTSTTAQNNAVTLVGTSPDDISSPSILTPNDSTNADLTTTTNSEITPDLFPDTSRYMHDLNMRLIYALKPSLDEYKHEKISFIHTGFSNLLKNLYEPLNAINSFLQLDFTSTVKTIGRFAINSTVGIVGIMDVAGPMGLRRNPRDFGQTLGVYGVPMGGFFVMPLYAQTTTRDFSGTIIDSFLNPINYVASWGVGLFIGVSNALMGLYESYDFIIATHESSLNSYDTFKTMYLQNRVKNINEYKLFSARKDSSTSSMALDLDSGDTADSFGDGSDTSAYDFDM